MDDSNLMSDLETLHLHLRFAKHRCLQMMTIRLAKKSIRLFLEREACYTKCNMSPPYN